MKTIMLEVSDLTAEKISRMTEVEKKSLSDELDRILSNRKSLEEIIHEASEQAKKNGLTPNKLEELLERP